MDFILSFLMSIIFVSLCSMVIISIRILLAKYLRSERYNYRHHIAPCISLYTRHKDLMRQQLALTSWSSLVDLWCGDGSALRFFSQYYNLRSLEGFDTNSVAIWRGKITNLCNHNNIHLFTQNFLSVDLQKYDYIYLFLLPKQLDDIQEWLQKNMRPDTVIICNTFLFTKRKPYQELWSHDSKSVIRLYKKEIR